MRHSITVSLCLAGALLSLALTAGGASAQGIDNAPRTPEAAEGMANEMLLRMGPIMGIDPEELAGASREEQIEMLRQRAQKMSESSIEGLQNFSAQPPGDTGTDMWRGATQSTPTTPLRPAPRRGFLDGSEALPVAEDDSIELVVDEPADMEMLVVAADTARHEIVWREIRTAPFTEHLDLGELAPDPNLLVLELIDPETHRVIRRYRPVAAAE